MCFPSLFFSYCGRVELKGPYRSCAQASMGPAPPPITSSHLGFNSFSNSDIACPSDERMTGSTARHISDSIFSLIWTPPPAARPSGECVTGSTARHITSSRLQFLLRFEHRLPHTPPAPPPPGVEHPSGTAPPATHG
jgi:hypothetical protein